MAISTTCRIRENHQRAREVRWCRMFTVRGIEVLTLSSICSEMMLFIFGTHFREGGMTKTVIPLKIFQKKISADKNHKLLKQNTLQI